MKKSLSYFFIFLVLLKYGIVSAQISTDETPPSFGINLNNHFEQKNLNPPNIDSLKRIDKIEDSKKEIPWRFGYSINTNFTLNNAGTWITLPNGDRIWRLEINSSGALSLNINYSLFHIPEDVKFFLYTPNKRSVLGAYTHKNENPDGTFATKPTRGDKIILELYEPKDKINQSKINISAIVYGYRDVFKRVETYGVSDSCNVNVKCDSDRWDPESRAVVMILTAGNTRFCSGALVNNTNFDGVPYVLTANHCNPMNNSIFMFRYQAPKCITNADGPLNYTLQGCQFKARRSLSDFYLVRLNNKPPADYKAFYAGWSAKDIPVWHSAVIHHPKGDVAKISKDNKPLVSTGYYAPGNTHWEVTSYDTGTTEAGSSGAPLFDTYHRVVGQLHGGSSVCDNNGFDLYGKFSMSWDNDADTAAQLKYWLDPNNTGKKAIDGYDPNGSIHINDVAAMGIIGINGFSCSSPSNAQLIVRNQGSDTLKSFKIKYNIDGFERKLINWTGNLAPYATTEIPLSFNNISGGYHEINALVERPNGKIDENTHNNTSNLNYIFNNYSHLVEVKVHTDSYGTETNWSVTDKSGHVYVQHKNYPNDSGGAVYTDTICLFENCFDFNLYDEYGDGFCCGFGNGWILVSDLATNDTLFYNNTFDSTEISKHFCLGTGCQLLVSASVERPDTAQSNGAINLHVLGGNGNYSYLWNTGDTVKDLKNIPTGNYQVIVQDSSCTDTLFIELSSTTGISENSDKNNAVIIYPNPGSNYLFIEHKNNLNEPSSLVIYNLLGQKLKERELNKNKVRVSTSSLKPGVYIIKVYNSKESNVFKYIKQ